MKSLPARLITTVTAATLLLGGGTCPAAEPAQNNYLLVNRPVGGDEIKIGMTLPLSGPSAQVGADLRAGCEASFKAVNDAGGIAGRKLKLVVYDDHNEPLRSVVNVEKMINQDQVFALCNSYGTPTTNATLGLLNDAKLPLVGCFTDGESLRSSVTPYVFHLRFNFLQETTSIVEHLVADCGAKKVAVVVQNDSFGDVMVKSAQRTLAERNLNLAATTRFVRNSVDVGRAVDELIAAQPDAVIIGGAAAPAAEIVKLARERGFRPYFCTVSFVGAEDFLQRAGPAAEGVVISQVVPSPYEDAAPNTAAYRKALQALPGVVPSHAGFEGYYNAQTIVDALRLCARDLTTESFFKALQEGQLDVEGQLNSTDVSPRQPFRQVFFTNVHDGKLETINTFPPLRR